MAVRFLGIGRQKARLNDRRKKLQNELEGREETLNQTLGQLTGLTEDAYNDAEMGLDERFGESLQRIEDQVAADRAGARRSVTRALMAGGGDITGQGAATLAEITATGNRALADATRNYTDAARVERRADLNRGDQLTLHGLNVNQDMLEMTLGQLMNTEQLDMMRRQANRQLLGDVVGAIASGAGKMAGGG